MSIKAYVAEGLGSALLLAVVVGSGIMGQRLAAGNDAVALLANALATGAGLVVLISLFGPLSGAHFNPAVTLVEALRGALPRSRVVGYLAMQVLGALLGVFAAHAMFGLPLLQASQHVRAGWPQWIAETIATAGLLLTILGGVRHARDKVPLLVALYIVAAYWFTASTSFANPAVTLARSLTDTFAGIRAADVPGFVLAQLAGAALGGGLGQWLFAERE